MANLVCPWTNTRLLEMITILRPTILSDSFHDTEDHVVNTSVYLSLKFQRVRVCALHQESTSAVVQEISCAWGLPSAWHGEGGSEPGEWGRCTRTERRRTFLQHGLALRRLRWTTRNPSSHKRTRTAVTRGIKQGPMASALLSDSLFEHQHLHGFTWL